MIQSNTKWRTEIKGRGGEKQRKKPKKGDGQESREKEEETRSQ
jgi:hypothetical protein